jgi:hypothetical protein
MTTQCCNSPANQVPGTFARLARVMQKNFIRQYEFAVLLRLLSSQYPPRSVESHTLRIASRTARNKGTKLRNLLTNLGWNPAMVLASVLSTVTIASDWNSVESVMSACSSPGESPALQKRNGPKSPTGKSSGFGWRGRSRDT